MKNLMLLWLLFAPFLASADATPLPYDTFATIPVLHEGRIKPLDSFARIALKRIYGHTELADTPAIAWLAAVFFDSEKATAQKIFHIRAKNLIAMLGLPAREDGDFSYQEISGPLSQQGPYLAQLLIRDKKSLSAEEQELVKLFVNSNDFSELLGSFSLLAPLQQDNAFHASDFLDLMVQKQMLEAQMRKTVQRKGTRLASYTPEEQLRAELLYRLDALEAAGKNNALLRVIPPTWEGTDEWLSPWMVMEKGAGSPATGQFFKCWSAMSAAYRDGNGNGWQQQSRKLGELSSGSPGVRSWALKLEVFYNKGALLNKSMLLYGLAVLLALGSVLSGRTRLGLFSYNALALGGLVHALALGIRMAILMRPPVSTLYESMVFVSFTACALGLWFERRRKSADGLIVSASIAMLLLMAATIFASDNDTLEVLVAVLNTNFWLGTHVICITTGYGSALVTGTMAHVYLFRRCLKHTALADLAPLERRIYRMALVALLFTSVGTMLGGIWADQSWGRFWGWDPKENGALWIVLWLIWLLHGRLSGQLRETGFMAIAALINIVVMLAWVGVNLLSVGLHSYGFTDEAAAGLGVFCAFEIVFVASTVWVIKVREKRLYAR